jgi:hypothetical protein
MLLEIEGKRYPMISADEATLADLIAIKRQTGIGVGELQEIAALFEGLEGEAAEKAAEEHPDEALVMFGVAVWLSRRAAGESLTLDEACAVPMDKIRQIAEPGDKAPAKKKAAKKSADPQ